MIWDILEILAHPEGWAITFRDGEIYIEDIAVLKDCGTTVKGTT